MRSFNRCNHPTQDGGYAGQLGNLLQLGHSCSQQHHIRWRPISYETNKCMNTRPGLRGEGKGGCIVGRRQSQVVQASPQRPAGDWTVSSLLPNSREEAVKQAADALRIAIQSAGKNIGRSKGLGKKKDDSSTRNEAFGPRLAVDVPVMGDSDAELVTLVEEILMQMAPSSSKFSFVLCSNENVDTVRNAVSNNRPVLTLVDAVAYVEAGEQHAVGDSVVLIHPRQTNLPDMERLFAKWNGGISVLMNPEWSATSGDVDAGVGLEHVAFVKTFQWAYCFFPIAVKVLFNTQEGCVYRNAADPKQLSGSKPWKIFLQNGSSWDAVAQMNRRPSSEEVEASLYNALAATNPGTKILKNLFNNKKK